MPRRASIQHSTFNIQHSTFPWSGGGPVTMDRLLRPRSVAIVGASAKPGSLGEAVLRNLEQAQFGGELFLVNPKAGEIRGRACLASVEDLPRGVDCAVLAIPRAGVIDAVTAC